MLLKSKKFLTIGKFLLAALILFVLSKSSQLNLILLKNVLHKPHLFFLSLCIFFMVLIVGAWRWHLLNCSQDISIGFKKTLFQSYIGTAFNNLLPGAIGGDAVRCYYFFKIFPDRKSTILSTILFDRIIGLLGIFTTIFVMALLHITLVFHQKEVLYLFSVISCVYLSIFSGLVAFMYLPKRFSLHNWFEKKFPRLRFVLFILKYLDSFREYRIEKSVFLKCLLNSFIMQVLIVVNLMLIADMLDLPSISFTNYAIAVGITFLVNLIPLTPGGVGMGEMAFAKILILLNPVSTIPYATIYLCFRMLSMLTYLPALIFYLPYFNTYTKRIIPQAVATE